MFQGVHAFIGAGLQLRIDLTDFFLANQVADGGGINQQFKGEAAAALAVFAEGLRENAGQGGGHLQAGLFLLIAGEDIHNPLHRFGGGGGMQGA